MTEDEREKLLIDIHVKVSGLMPLIDSFAKEIDAVRADRVVQSRVNSDLSTITERHESLLNWFWQKIIGIALAAAFLAVGAGVAILRQ